MPSALIIGASSSLGREVVKDFSNSGYNVLASYSSNKKVLRASKTVSPIHLELNSNESISEFTSFISSNGWSFDVCIFIAGFLPGNNLKDYEINEIDEVMSINFSGFSKVFKCLQTKFNKDSQIIVVSSISAQRGSYDPIYAASKGALISFMKSLSQSKPLRVRANAVAPGLIKNTSMYDDMDKTIH